MTGKRRGTVGRIGELLLLPLLVLAGFVFLEGLSSTGIGLLQLLHGEEQAEASRYDASLGWTGIPDANVPDMYGPGRYVRTNSQGYRNADEFTQHVDNRRIRMLCSGDSFTYGQGVANDEVWCNRLSALDPRLETVNLGMPGYGVDQMYLRYLEARTTLEHQIHIFAFIGGDLIRMGNREQNHFGKPVLHLDGDRLVVGNTPVPRLRWSLTRLLDRADFRLWEVCRKIMGRLLPGPAATPDIMNTIGPVAERTLLEIDRLGREQQVTTVFVFLPTDLNVGKDKPWHTWTLETMARHKLYFYDLTPLIRELPAHTAAGFFIPRGQVAEGHYTAAGNAWVADALLSHLVASHLLPATGIPRPQ